MRTHPEDTNKAQIRAELRKQSISTAQTEHLKKSFISNASRGHVELAHTALNMLPKDEQNKLDKSEYFHNLIEQGRTDIIDETQKNGTQKDKQQLYIETLKIEERIRIDNILTSINKSKPTASNTTHGNHFFSRMKSIFNTMLGRSVPIAAENSSNFPQKAELSDGQTDSMSSDSDTERQPVIQHREPDYFEHEPEQASNDEDEDRRNFDNRI
ncbi:MAG: hypothetical protein P1U36_03370 [Legionellaceae bacterium]|nr:hypothetical protein [Legionellaceae bacterium]